MTASGRIWIQGAGELASGVAVRLVRCGYQVVMADLAHPLAVRRRVSFCEAIYEGRTRVEEVEGILLPSSEARFLAGIVTVVVDPEARSLAGLKVAAAVDARMTKKPPIPLPGLAAPLIGLGPGFTCGPGVDFVIETHREARLGSVISTGSAVPDTGVAGLVGGQTGLRVLRAPAPGHLSPLFSIGDLVEEGMVIGHVGGIPVLSGLSGMIRGLVHPEAELFAGTKVGDVDPRGRSVDNSLVSDKCLAVGGGVLEALLRLKVLPTAT